MKNNKVLLCAGACLLFSAAACAAPPESGSLPLWEAGVGGGWVSTPAYPAADTHSSRPLVLPFLLYRGEILRSDQSGIGARLLRSNEVEFDVGFAASLPAHSEDVSARRGMPDLGTLVEFGPRLKYKLGDIDPTTRLRFELPLRAVIEVRDGLRRKGWILEPRLVWETVDTDGNWTWNGQLGAVFGDARINRYFYEVRPQFATPGRAAYAAGGGFMLLRAGLFVFRRINPDLRVFGFTRLESYAGSSNSDSPLFRRNVDAAIGFGLAWSLARSSERARE